MIHVQERAKEDPSRQRTVSACETWISARFDGIYDLLSLEPRLAYTASNFLTTRTPEPKFVAKLRDLETPWEELFSRTHPWCLYHTLHVLNESLKQYKQGLPDYEWVVHFGEKFHERIVDLVEWLSRKIIKESDWPYCMYNAVAILDGFLHLGIQL